MYVNHEVSLVPRISLSAHVYGAMRLIQTYEMKNGLCTFQLWMHPEPGRELVYVNPGGWSHSTPARELAGHVCAYRLVAALAAKVVFWNATVAILATLILCRPIPTPQTRASKKCVLLCS